MEGKTQVSKAGEKMVVGRKLIISRRMLVKWAVVKVSIEKKKIG